MPNPVGTTTLKNSPSEQTEPLRAPKNVGPES